MFEIPFIAAMISAIVVENAILTRALGMDKSVLYLNSPKQGIIYGGVLTWMVTVSSLTVSLVNLWVADHEHVDYLRAPFFLLCVIVVYCGTYFAARQMPPGFYRAVRPYLPFATFNSAVFSAFFVAANSFRLYVVAERIPRTVGYALGTGIGYTLAVLIIYYARKRLAISPVPRAFRGLPILLVYIGILSMALLGLVGSNLPT